MLPGCFDDSLHLTLSSISVPARYASTVENEAYIIPADVHLFPIYLEAGMLLAMPSLTVLSFPAVYSNSLWPFINSLLHLLCVLVIDNEVDLYHLI